MVTVPHVLIASTSADIAGYLEAQLSEACRTLGLLLQVGPQSAGKSFHSSEHLFFELSSRDPAELLDTLVILHVGVELEECFESKVSDISSDWHAQGTIKPGVAMELILRFPQVSPIFLSPLVPPDVGPSEESEWVEFQAWLNGWLEDVGRGAGQAAEAHLLPAWERIHFASTVDKFVGLKKTLERFANGFRSIFDPTGFRSLLRNRFLAQVFGTLARDSNGEDGWDNTKRARGQLNQRLSKLVVVLEEESDLTLLSGYAAYKFGYRSWMISSYGEFVNEAPPDWGWAHNLLLIRDIDLRLPDIIPSDNPEVSVRSDLRNIHSGQWAGRLAHAKVYTVRVLSQDASVISVSKFTSTKHDADRCEIIAHLKTRAGAGGTAPAAGISADIKDVDVNAHARRLGQTCKCSGGYKFIGLTKPLRSIYAVTDLLSDDGGQTASLISMLPQIEDMKQHAVHGAPYMNLRIATDLIQQARRCREARETRPLLVAALLAQEAYSLLLGMSRTTSLAALREMHLAEAAVESSSTGITYSVSIRERRDDLTKSVNNISPEDPGLNFLAKLWADLRLVYKDGEQFEASERANIESLVNADWITSSHRRWGRSAWIRKAVTHLKRGLLKPIHSFFYLVAFWLTWSLFLTILYCYSQSRWTLSLTNAGVLNFVDVYVRVLVAIGRAEKVLDEGLPVVGSEGLLYIVYRLTDVLCAITSVLAIGLVVSVIFRKSTRG